MFNIKKADSDTLRKKYAKAIIASERRPIFYNLAMNIANELNRRNRAILYREACRVLKLRKFNNQFQAAAYFADACLDDPNYFCDMAYYEISGFYTKNGNPVCVFFN